MNTPQPINVYGSQSSEYYHAFQTFLNHTDQKAKAHQWLNGFVETLPSRQVFIDVGAGNGLVTSWFTDAFDQTIALEPNDSLRAELKNNCPLAEVFSEGIMEAAIADSGDFVLCSHVLYYLDSSDWMPTLEKLASMLSSDGILIVVLQHHDTQCMRMMRHFLERSFDLPALARAFRDKQGDRYEVAIETVPAHVNTTDFNSAYTIAEFMLNLLPMDHPPARRDLEDYVRNYFICADLGFRFSCDQDFLQIRPR
ncbi:class I SAM-dependent methyltransferase [Methylosarcina fibrata]|uniref:class I SAM-dependent methyltransferase n=1 Tax=Methylosarcina fibrata TaxID=105972 RepID=UPI0003790912|nr:methyltransferase domain-containing protein [Methylosarcina fibrata]